VGVFNVDGFTSLKVKRVPGDGQDLFAKTFQMHLNPPLRRIERGQVFELVEVCVAAQFAVYPDQQVFVETRGHAGAVIVSGLQPSRIFLEIYTDEKCASVSYRLSHALQKLARFGVLEVADRRFGKKSTAAAGRGQPIGQVDRLVKSLATVWMRKPGYSVSKLRAARSS
jgi:hypothetical protein